MDRRTLIVSGLVTLGASGLARAQQPLPPAQPRGGAAPREAGRRASWGDATACFLYVGPG